MPSTTFSSLYRERSLAIARARRLAASSVSIRAIGPPGPACAGFRLNSYRAASQGVKALAAVLAACTHRRHSATRGTCTDRADLCGTDGQAVLERLAWLSAGPEH